MSSYIRAIRLVNFRNYRDAAVSLAPGLNVVVGDNAQGKTNLLESLAFTATGSSPRTPNDSEVVRWGAEFARTEMRVVAGGRERAVAVGYAPGQKKRLSVDGVRRDSLARYAAGEAGVRVVNFFPDDIRVVKGAPADRREFLDGILSSLRPAYARAAADYARAVQHRNQLLRRIRDGISSRRTLSTWDRRVVELGLQLLRGREAAIGPLGEMFSDALRALYGSQKAGMRYSHSVTPEAYAEALREAHESDIERGRTSVGPHRDDFTLLLGGVDLTTYGSQGQQRLATLALKFAAREYVREVTGEDPVLLMDDVMSELDERRREYVAGYFMESSQAVVTTTNREYFSPQVLKRARVVRVAGGSVIQEPDQKAG
ncbi:DNA replication/repair protein RecF [Rubrobacter taiwanensis]|jgi:DNA replication and repair protein RecF|uniref:DNA replication and repair protein RecF n=1 Tax=Rubrobacter taiwanensis TaxID=185139 RepID=A0A4R1BFH7_9ACTN|nr:DNA replication/repair protein RecF [Rubrobacter taiwanensis]TCJ15909.1 DNA replication/repair protein RecF [Rubrobacter taiwanensis]